MKRTFAITLAFVLVLLCITCVNAEIDSAVVFIKSDNMSPSVGDVITVTVSLKDITSGEFIACDSALFYNSDVLKYNKEHGIKINKVLSEMGVGKIYTDASDSLIRCAAGFGIDSLDRMPATVGDTVDVWYVQFEVLAEGDTGLGFAAKDKTPVYDKGLDTGFEAYLGNNTNKADIVFEPISLITKNGNSDILITEIEPVSDFTVSVGTAVEDVLLKLPETVTVKLSNGETGSVKMSWIAGSLISTYNPDVPGEYYFTGNITDSGDFINYNNLLSMVKVTVKEESNNTFGSGEADTGNVPEDDVEDRFEIIMIIGSDKPTVAGEVVPIDVPAMIIDDRTMTPARFVAEALGAEVLWDDSAKTVTIRNESTEIILKINSTTVLINGEEVETDVPAMIIDSRTLTPSRLVAEALGAEVLWDDLTKTVTIIK